MLFILERQNTRTGSTMNVSLTPELEKFVDGKVESGLYNNASEVVREGLRLLKEHDELRKKYATQIERGWQQAGGNGMRDVAASTPSKSLPAPPVYQQTPVQRQPAERPIAQSIIGTVRFNANPAERYFVTDNYQLVQVQNQQVKSIARLARSNSSRFPYVIYDEQNNQLLVSAQGAIITKNGKEVGSMQAYKG